MKVLALCDSPAGRPEGHLTGFGRVAKNLFTEWSKQGVEVDVWALHFTGHGYRDVPWQLFPGGGNDWNSPRQLTAFLNQLAAGGYTHCWILMDADALCVADFPEKFRKCCRKHHIKSMLYFPIDAPQDAGWMEFAKVIDVPVTYTQYGAGEVRRVASFLANRVQVIPHGLDAAFQPVADRTIGRDIQLENGKSFLAPDDFLILNVNKNEWRKDPLRSLEILQGLRKLGVPAKLVLRMAPRSGVGGIDLERAAAQLGLEVDRDWTYLGAVPEEHLPKLYSAADLYLTTTLGEGWGLGITEALGCGTPVAMPDHTACGEIGRRIADLSDPIDRHPRIVWLEQEPGCVCGSDTRLRRRVGLAPAIRSIVAAHNRGLDRHVLQPSIRAWLSWERIAAEMLALLKGEA